MEARDFSRVSLHDIMQYQASFSKYGAYYSRLTEEKERGGKKHAA